MFPPRSNDNECLTIKLLQKMKRVFVLMTAALMGLMSIPAEAKVVRGYVTDRDGNPVQGVRMLVVNKDSPDRGCAASTDADGFFSVQVPDNLNTLDILDIFSQNGTRVVRYRETGGTLRITIEPKKAPAGQSRKQLARR